jgi:photosystem II stability/assembly factor-like uncharacterized protein
MKLPRYFPVLAALTSLFALRAGAQGVAVHPQPAPAGASTIHQPTPEQIAKMPVTALPIKDFKLLSSGTGWVSTGSKLLWTTDNGAHWKDISPSTPALADPRDDKFSGVFFLDANTGWVVSAVDTNDTTPYGTAVGSDALLSSTTDGGATWTTVKLPRADTVRNSGGSGSIAFSDKLHGWFDLGLTGNTAVQPGALFVTSDGGRTWRRAKGDPKVSVDIAALTEKDAWFAGGPDYKLYVTHDGANTVYDVSLPVPDRVPADDYPTYGLPVFIDKLNGYEEVTYTGAGDDKAASVLFATGDGGRTWKPDRILLNLAPGIAGDHQFSTMAGSTWIHSFSTIRSEHRLMKLAPKSGTTDGANSDLNHHNCDLSFITPDEGWMNCSGNLSATIDGGATLRDITPRVRNGNLTTDPVTPIQTFPIETKTIKMPGMAKNTRNSAVPSDAQPNQIPYVSGMDQHLGFDKTDVLLRPNMQKWWNSSPYYDVGIYLPDKSPGKHNRHNDKNLLGQTGVDWVDAAIGQGWGIIPIWFGLQAPCGNDNTPDTKTYNTNDAAAKGAEQADLAYNSATNLGLDGTIVYFDVEPYNTLSKECSAAVRDYIGAVVKEMHINAPGGSVGVYAAVDAAGGDIHNASPMPDDIWVAQRLGKRVTVWNLAAGAPGQTLSTNLTDDMWPNYQRMHQYRIPYKNKKTGEEDKVLETWGGAGPYNIDEDIVDATIVQSSGTKKYPTIGYIPFSPGSMGDSLLGIANGVDNALGLKLGEAVGSYALSDTPSYPEYYPGNYPTAGFTYLGGATTAPISFSGAYETIPNGINNLGQIVGSYGVVYDEYGDQTTHGFYTTASKPTTPIPLDYSGAMWTELIGINDAGWIVGNYIDVDDTGVETGHCALWKPPYTDPQPFDMPGAQPLSLNGCSGINGLGQIIGQAANSEGTFTPFVDDAEAGDPNNQANFSTVSAPDYAWYVSVVGINNNGQIAGSYYDVTSLLGAGFLLNGSEFIPFPNPVNSEDNFSLYGINDDVQMVAGDVILNGLPIQP